MAYHVWTQTVSRSFKTKTEMLKFVADIMPKKDVFVRISYDYEWSVGGHAVPHIKSTWRKGFLAGK
jgi:hypothetical protein|tara:strand:- start:29 stop:226 length:198 start_codon:yes stop_codon:yes gene_type:complete